jgi:S-adenosylmethionine hydrolase
LHKESITWLKEKNWWKGIRLALLAQGGRTMSRIITLTTDFGLEDEYVGVMKGVMLARAPKATIIDLSHAIERQNIRQAGLLIKSAYRFFPDKTIHLVVVDPGVGSNRKLILLQADGHLFLAPDNGVLGLLFGAEHFQAAYEVQCEQYYLAPVSPTFHGRDILAPVAAELASGLDPAAVGLAVTPQTLKNFEFATAKIDSGQSTITGEIIGVDHFGNLQTNITGSSLENLFGNEKPTARVTVKGETIIGIQDTYANKAPGEILAIVGSRGFLEIAVNQGDAATLLDAGIGVLVSVELHRT